MTALTRLIARQARRVASAARLAFSFRGPLALLLALALPLTISCSGGKESIAATGISLPEARSVQVGKQATLTASVQPPNATNKSVSWQSDNDTIASVSNGTVTANAIGAATITAIAADGGFVAHCEVTVTQYDPLEEAARLREFERLSGEVNVKLDKVELKTMDDFITYGTGVFFGYGSASHTAQLFEFVVSSTVTDPTLRTQLVKEAEWTNNWLRGDTEHEFHHAANSKYVNTIKEPKKHWKAKFLDEMSAYLTQGVLYIAVWDPTYTVPSDAEGVKELLFSEFDNFSRKFDNNAANYRSAINMLAFGKTNLILSTYDTDEWFNTALNAMFTYPDLKNCYSAQWERQGRPTTGITFDMSNSINLFQMMAPADQQEFLKRLNDKMELEYERYHSGYYNAP